MQIRGRTLAWVTMGILVLTVPGCGGSYESPKQTPVPPAPGAAAPTEFVAPPGDQDVDIEPGSVAMGNVLSSSGDLTDQLPPQAFGTAQTFTLDNIETTQATLTMISLYKDADNYLTISRDPTTKTVTWQRVVVDANKQVHPTLITAYTPSGASDCSRMASNLVDFFKSGNTISYTTSGSTTPQTGTFQPSGSGDNKKTPKIKLTITLASGNSCAPSGP